MLDALNTGISLKLISGNLGRHDVIIGLEHRIGESLVSVLLHVKILPKSFLIYADLWNRLG